VNPIDELARVLPSPPASRELPRQQQHKTELLTIVGADRRRRRARRKPAPRRWLAPAMAGAAVAAVAILAVTVPGLLSSPSGSRSGSSAQTGPSAAPTAGATAPRPGSRLTRTLSWSVPATRFDRIAVDVARGSVIVVGGSASAAAITATPDYAGQAPVLSSRVEGGTLAVLARCPREPDCQVSLTLRVPAGARVQAASDLGDVRVTGLHGDVTASSQRGRLVLTDLSGRVSATDALGDVTLAGITGPVTAQTAEGSIKASGLAAAQASLSSQDGDITAVFVVAPAQVTASTRLGDVAIRIPSTVTYDVIASTQLGNTAISVPRSAGSRHVIKATSQLGSVTVAG
jgi:hypothetical protein